MIKQNMKHLNRIFVIVDALLIAAALFCAWYIRIESGLMEVADWVLSFGQYMRPLIFLVPSYLIIYSLFDLYKPRRMKSVLSEIINLIKANTIGILLFLGYLYIANEIHYSRIVLLLFYFFSLLMDMIERLVIRYILRRIRKKNKNLKHIVLVGYSDLALEYSKKLYANNHWGYNIKGVFDDDIKRSYVSLNKKSVPLLGSLKDLGAYIESNDLDEVVVTLSLDKYSHLAEVVDTCERRGVFTRIVPDYYKIIPAKPYVEDLDGLPVISLRMIPLNDIMKKGAKRAFDIIVSLLGTIVLSPMFLLIVVLIKLESKEPVLYKQIRVGLNRREFSMYKFRSMVAQNEDDEKECWTRKNDPRVTKVGAFIRRTSLDEFPQLINVIKGDMSLVGPRPERPQFVEKYKEEIPKYMVKHQVRPGMTGWAQVHGLRGDTSIKKRIEYDLYYIENWSYKMEIKIFFMTFLKGFINKNAY